MVHYRFPRFTDRCDYRKGGLAVTYSEATAILTNCQHEPKPCEWSTAHSGDPQGRCCTDCWNAHVFARRQARREQLAQRPNDCQRCGNRPVTYNYGGYLLCGFCKSATEREHNKAMAQAGGLGIFAQGLLVNTKEWAAAKVETGS